jgi:nucleoid-associated protein YgaU
MFVRIGIVLVSAVLLWALLARDTGASGAPAHYRVKARDSLWSIASTRYPGDLREGVWRIEQANRLPDATIRPGQVLLLP